MPKKLSSHTAAPSDSFDDIVAAVALFRPGPLDAGMVDDYVERKHGRAKVNYPHPLTEPILKPTYGVILYQEQVMQIAQTVGGYTLGSADILRKAMGKKDPQIMADQRAVFIEGAQKNGVEPHDAKSLFDSIEKFAGYGFNKSHSVAYALVAYQTAWLKAHHPAEFMAAVLSADLDHTDKIANLIEDCRAMRLKLLPPDINHSAYRFQVESGSIRYGLGAIKGMGEAVIEHILAVRERGGRFESLGQMLRSLELAKITRKQIETLIRAGAFESISANQSALIQALPDAWATAERHQSDAEAGQASLFGAASTTGSFDDSLPEVAPWTTLQRLNAEHKALGLYLTGHPMDDLRDELAGFVSCRLGDLCHRIKAPSASEFGGDDAPRKRRNFGTPMTLAGMVRASRRSRNGLFVAIDDGSAKLEVAVFERFLSDFSHLLNSGEVIVVSGKVDIDDFNGGFRMVAEQVISLDDARARFARCLHLHLAPAQQINEIEQDLAAALRPYRNGSVPVLIDYCNDKASTRLKLGPDWRIQPCAELMAAMQTLDSVERAELVYR
ncbi:MAG: DNA polymerase III subunit alpha [Pseudomonadota bacterium]